MSGFSFRIDVFRKRIQKLTSDWRKVQEKTSNAVNTILGVVGKIGLVQNKELYGKLESFEIIRDSVTYKLLEQINRKVPELRKSIDSYERIVIEMQRLLKAFRSSYRTFIRSSDRTQIEIMEMADASLEEVVRMFEEELQLRKIIVKEMRNPLNPGQYTLYMTIWAAEPFVEQNRIIEILEEFDNLELQYQRGTIPGTSNPKAYDATRPPF
ncbi:MAG: hypothetical protein ACFFC7_17995 [Candidatus Hermodarchaeota archaeon]